MNIDRRLFSTQLLITFSLLAAGLWSDAAVAQRRDKKPKLPAPESLTLGTKDALLLKCKYYPGTKGRETVPVILLHGAEGPRGVGSGNDWDGLALKLQAEGHAVIVPDLRGYGGSTTRKRPGQEAVTIDRIRMRAADFADMVAYDLEAVKKFLMTQHNKEQLNIEMLCVVGADMGSVVALNWIAQDWSWPQLAALKQGQDVKAFVLVSPIQSFKGLPTRKALAVEAVRSRLSAMIVYGRQDNKATSAGKRIYKTLKNSHGPIPKDQEEKIKKQDLFLVEFDTSLQGTKLLSNRNLDLSTVVADFIRLRLVNKKDDYPWVSRAR